MVVVEFGEKREEYWKVVVVEDGEMWEEAPEREQRGMEQALVDGIETGNGPRIAE